MANIYEKLNEKMHKEYELFLEEMKTKEPAEIIENACEITIKNEILFQADNLESTNLPWLTKNQAEALYNQEFPLDACYARWLKIDGVSLSEDVMFCMENESEILMEKSATGRIEKKVKTEEYEL